MSTQLESALPQITDLFEHQSQRAYRWRELSSIFSSHREEWGLLQKETLAGFVEFLLDSTDLKKITLNSDTYGQETRYVWHDASVHQIALSLRQGSYFSHGAAVFLHGLTDQVPRIIYVNKEQSPKPQPTGPLAQDAIDRAFAAEQRLSRYVYRYKKYRIRLLSGKSSGNFGVDTVAGPSGEPVAATNLARTLIDITVRPAYAGGVYHVLEAYRTALNKVSIDALYATLRKLDYKYPYHQSVGFYLDKAGAKPESLLPFKRLGVEFDFYIDYGIKQKQFDHEWRLCIPKGF